MARFICITCGTQYPESGAPPGSCPICEDDRQFVHWGGQTWVTLPELQVEHRNAFKRFEPDLYGIQTEPKFGIGQRALLVRTPEGNVLWECLSLIEDGTIDLINGLGGISAIAISHPHYYSSMVEWSHAFGKVPILLHHADAEWVMRPDPVVQFWDGDTHRINGGITLVRCGGHFAGGTVLHWAKGAGGRGALLTGDIIQVVQDRRFVTFMRSYPNFIPLPADSVQRIRSRVEPLHFDRIYGAFWNLDIAEGAKQAVRRSADRYLAYLESEEGDRPTGQ